MTTGRVNQVSVIHDRNAITHTCKPKSAMRWWCAPESGNSSCEDYIIHSKSVGVKTSGRFNPMMEGVDFDVPINNESSLITMWQDGDSLKSAMPEGLRFNTSLFGIRRDTQTIKPSAQNPRKDQRFPIVCTLKKQANPDKSEWITRTHSFNENRYRCQQSADHPLLIILSWSVRDPSLNLSWSVRAPLLIHRILDWSFSDQSDHSVNLYWSVRAPLPISHRSFTDQSEILYWPITSFTDPFTDRSPFLRPILSSIARNLHPYRGCASLWD